MPWIRKTTYDKMTAAAKGLIEELDKLKQHAILIDVTTEGRMVKFLFSRGNEIIEIKTIRALSDDVGDWQSRLVH